MNSKCIWRNNPDLSYSLTAGATILFIQAKSWGAKAMIGVAASWKWEIKGGSVRCLGFNLICLSA